MSIAYHCNTDMSRTHLRIQLSICSCAFSRLWNDTQLTKPKHVTDLSKVEENSKTFCHTSCCYFTDPTRVPIRKCVSLWIGFFVSHLLVAKARDSSATDLHFCTSFSQPMVCVEHLKDFNRYCNAYKRIPWKIITLANVFLCIYVWSFFP